ncbi:MAG TPA: hypothetical protein PKD90_00760 [Phnomibacter sp.]|nr:hypothetical protein [Phnomibacter sp.]
MLNNSPVPMHPYLPYLLEEIKQAHQQNTHNPSSRYAYNTAEPPSSENDSAVQPEKWNNEDELEDSAEWEVEEMMEEAEAFVAGLANHPGAKTFGY